MKLALCAPTDIHALAGYCGRSYDGIAPGLGSTATTPLIIELLRRGHAVTVYTLSNGLASGQFYDWGNLRVFVGPSRLFGSPRDFYRIEVGYLKRTIKADGPSFVHAHWTYEFALGALLSGVPTITTIHDLPWNVLRYYRDRCRAVRLLMAYMVAAKGKIFTAVSQDAAHHFNCWFSFGADIKVIPNFLRQDVYELSRAEPLRCDHNLRFATVLQGWSRRKNGRCALVAFRKVKQCLPEARMVMVGSDYEENGPAHTWAKSNGMDKGVTFLGFMEHECMLQYLSQEIDILVHPSLDEAFSVTVLECMALRKPVIGGINTPGLRGVLEYGKVGVLVDVHSSDAIAEGMVRLAMSEKLRERISNAAYEKSWAEYRADVVLPRYESLYEEWDANALRASTEKTCGRGTA